MTGEYVHDFGTGEDFLNKTQKALIEENVDKLGYIKLMNYFLSKHAIKRVKTGHGVEKILTALTVGSF